MAKRRWLNRDIVVETAVRLADEAGTADALTLKQLAATLNVRVPSLYNHVDGLEGLQQEMAVVGVRRLTQALRRAAFGKVGREALLAMAHAYRDFAHTHPGLYGFTIVAPDPDQEALVAAAQELVQFLLMALASYHLTGDEALHAVRGLRAVLHGFVSLESAEGFKMALDRDESFTRLVTTYVDGLSRHATNGAEYSAP